ncbi:MAG: V-type ATP synthase subunit D, partial [candidate division WOR-3 bacterium]|nr:V-type ATP synthase subunit D [candidate division WOR-3 bacterium]
MIQQNVNATRMELLNQKKRLKLAKRGHKLLKDKQDELMRQMMLLIDEVRELRVSIEEEFQSILSGFVLAKAEMENYEIEEALAMPQKKVTLDVDEKNLMSVKVPRFTKNVKGKIISYGYMNTTGEMDIALIEFDKFLESLFELAEKEKTVQLLADEIDKTRRRVNALEYKLIPNLEDTIKYITMKLQEMERATLTRLMKVKDIVREH